MKGWLVTFLLLAGMLGGVGWLFEDELPFIQGFDGRIVRCYQDQVGNVSTQGVESTPMLEIETALGRLHVAVPSTTFGVARPGMAIHKRRFSKLYRVQP